MLSPRFASLLVLATATASWIPGRSAWAAEPAPAAASAPAPAGPAAIGTMSKSDAAVARIDGVALEGTLIDPPESLLAYVNGLFPTGSPFVESGPADRVGIPIGTAPRVRKAFDEIGYDATVTPASMGDKVKLIIALRPYDRVRQIFVRGNWPLRQDEILRRITLRAGQALPLPVAARTALLNQDRERILAFLRAEGYLDAQVSIEVESRSTVPSPINLMVRVHLGKSYPLGSVKVAGNQALEAPDIENRFRHNDWLWLWSRPLPFKQSVFREDIAGLLKQYHALGFPAARVLDSTTVNLVDRRVDVTLDVREKKKVEVVFEGNHCCLESTLRDALTLFTRGTYDDYEIADSAESLARAYRERGYMLVAVKPRRERLNAGAERVVFAIDEGPQLKVRGVTFMGNKTLPADELRDAVAVKPYPFLGFLGLGAGGYASPRQLELDVDALAEFYRARGFPSATASVEIGHDGQTWRPLKDALAAAAVDPSWRHAQALYVRFLIDEGPRITIGRIEFQSDDGRPLTHDQTFFRAALLSQTAGPYRPALVRDDEERLRRLLGDDGYAYAEPHADVRVEGNQAMVLWTIKPGPLVHVGPVFIRGNFWTHESTVLRWIPLQTGAPLTTTKIERGQRNLALMQLFNNANPIRFPGQDERRDVVPMLIQVEERHDHWGVVHVGGGISTEQMPADSSFPVGFFASAGYEHRNLLGLGYTFLTQGQIGTSLRRVQSSFLDPRFWGTRFRLEIQGSYLTQQTVRLGDIESWTGSIGFAREMAPGVDAFLRYNLRNTLRTEFLIRAEGPDATQNTVRLGTLVGSVSTGIDWQRLDNPLVPTRGFKMNSNVEFAQPALVLDRGDSAFVKVQARSLVVMPVGRRFVLQDSVRYDQGFPLGGDSVLPKVERFFAGGDTTIRGFELDRARSQVITSPLAPGINRVEYLPLGGSLRILHNLELQVPLVGPVWGAVFLDSGLVADSFDRLSITNFRHGVGFSPLLIRLPVGDVSLAWAWPLDPQPGDSRIGRLHFNVGLLF